MKENKLQNLVIALLAIAVAVLFCMQLSQSTKKNTTNNTNAETVDVEKSEVKEAEATDSTAVSVSSDIAYVNVDSLLSQYEYAKDLNKALLKKQKDAQSQLEAKANQLRNDYQNVQARYQKGLLSQDQAQIEGNRLNKQQQDIQELEAKLTKQMVDEQQKMNKQLIDKVHAFFKAYNEDKHYKAIFSNSGNDNILYSVEGLDITDDVVKKLNAEYKNKK